MKKYWGLAQNFIFVILIIYILSQRAPTLWKQYQMQNQAAGVLNVMDLSGQPVILPMQNQKQVFIFWATWCAPCKLELSRVQDLITNNKVSKDFVFAIAMGESQEDVKKVAAERGYTFHVLVDASMRAADEYQVAVTPTIIFVNEKGKNEWVSSGVSPTLSMRMTSFLTKSQGEESL